MKPRTDYEQRFYFALRQITAYMTPAQLRRCSEKSFGVTYFEGLEMAYENIQAEARAALKGYRKPKPVLPPPGKDQ